MSVIEVTVVAGVILIGLTIVWSTVKVGISPMPSSLKVREVIISLMKDTGSGPVYELGSGWGGLAVMLAKRFPDRTIVGYEVSIIPWFASVLLQKILRLDNLKFYRGNFLQANLTKAEVLVCYLHTDGMHQIANKLKAEGCSNCYLVSSTFALPAYQIDASVQVEDFYRSPVYRYKLSADVR